MCDVKHMFIFLSYIHPSTHCSMGSAPVGVQCPFTSSLDEFPGYWDWLWYTGLSTMLVSIAFPFALNAFHISVFFHSLVFTCNWISFMCLLYDWCICTHWLTLHLLTFFEEFPGLGLALVPDVVVPEAEHWCTWSRNLVSNFCPGRGLNRGPCSLMAANVTTKLRCTPLSYMGPIKAEILLSVVIFKLLLLCMYSADITSI